MTLAHWEDVADGGQLLTPPRSNKIFLRGIGLIGRVEPLDYFDGEPS